MAHLPERSFCGRRDADSNPGNSPHSEHRQQTARAEHSTRVLHEPLRQLTHQGLGPGEHFLAMGPHRHAASRPLHKGFCFATHPAQTKSRKPTAPKGSVTQHFLKEAFCSFEMREREDRKENFALWKKQRLKETYKCKYSYLYFYF